MYNDFDRRAFLKVGSLSLFGFIGYGDVLRLRAQSPAPAKRDIAIIHLLLSGGISQMDSWDPKPDADSKYRSQFKPIETNVAGIRISEHLPMTAKQADKFVIIRSMTHKLVSHESALALICSGHEPLGTQHPAHLGNNAHGHGHRLAACAGPERPLFIRQSYRHGGNLPQPRSATPGYRSACLFWDSWLPVLLY